MKAIDQIFATISSMQKTMGELHHSHQLNVNSNTEAFLTTTRKIQSAMWWEGAGTLGFALLGGASSIGSAFASDSLRTPFENLGKFFNGAAPVVSMFTRSYTTGLDAAKAFAQTALQEGQQSVSSADAQRSKANELALSIIQAKSK
jgi:hypothetical protein